MLVFGGDFPEKNVGRYVKMSFFDGNVTRISNSTQKKEEEKSEIKLTNFSASKPEKSEKIIGWKFLENKLVPCILKSQIQSIFLITSLAHDKRVL